MKKFLHLFLFSLLIFSILLIPLRGFYKFLIIVLLLVCHHIFNVDSLFSKKNNCIKIFFGAPGAGKTTFCAYLAQMRHKQNEIVLSNVDISNTYMLDPLRDLGSYSTYFSGKGCTVIIDEATLDYDGRGFKSFSSENRNYFSLFRHDCNEVFLFSQAVDMDKRIRDRASSCYYLQRSLLPGFIKIRKIKKMIAINDDKQLIDGFDFVPFSMRLLPGFKYYKYFDTLDRNLCCKKERKWQPWRQDELPLIDNQKNEIIDKSDNNKKIINIKLNNASDSAK